MSATRIKYGGRYEVIEPVGSGGMAEVYRARDELLGREVAVKVLSDRFSRDRAFVERFRREAQSAANLNHPNIVSLYDYGSEDDDAYFIVMEYIDGRSLADIIRGEGPLLAERAAEIAADVAQALGRAHANGVVHRDIKPANIMITSSGQTKVTDFGIARAVGGDGEQTMTQTGMVIGTAAYLSPEQAQGNPVDARSDVYSLGIVLFEMLTGTTPFTGDSPLSVAYKHVREDPRPPSAVNPDVPAELDAVVMKALAKNPENRYSSAAEMYEDLQRFLSGQTVMATPLLADQTQLAPAPATQTEILRETYQEPEPARSRAWLWVISALAILALFGVLAWLLFSNLVDEGELIDVPRVVGMQLNEARDVLEDRGFEHEVERRTSDEPKNEVLEQDPPAGEQLEEGGIVTLTVSSGPAQVAVPDLTGMTIDEARAELREADLKLGTQTPEETDEFEEGEIFDQDPAAGEEAPTGSRVDVTVAAAAETVTVPSVVDQTEEEAVEELEAAGLDPSVRYEPNSDYEAGIVFAQDPGPGEEVAPGTTVVVTVSEGPEEQPMPNVRGQDADDAESRLEQDYGLNVTVVEQACVDAVPPGNVCDQDPPPGTLVSPGDDATLYVQEGGASLSDSFALGLLALLQIVF